MRLAIDFSSLKRRGDLELFRSSIEIWENPCTNSAERYNYQRQLIREARNRLEEGWMDGWIGWVVEGWVEFALESSCCRFFAFSYKKA